VVLQPGPAGTAVVATVEHAEAVIVAGAFGKGRVVLSGMTLGCRQTGDAGSAAYEAALSSGEQKVLVNSVYWLGERFSAATVPATVTKPNVSSGQLPLDTLEQKTEQLLQQVE